TAHKIKSHWSAYFDINPNDACPLIAGLHNKCGLPIDRRHRTQMALGRFILKVTGLLAIVIGQAHLSTPYFSSLGVNPLASRTFPISGYNNRKVLEIQYFSLRVIVNTA